MLTAQAQVTGRESSRQTGMGGWGGGTYRKERRMKRAEERVPPRERDADVTWQRTRQLVFAVLARQHRAALKSRLYLVPLMLPFPWPSFCTTRTLSAVNTHRSSLWRLEGDAAGVTITPLTVSSPDHPPNLINWNDVRVTLIVGDLTSWQKEAQGECVLCVVILLLPLSLPSHMLAHLHSSPLTLSHEPFDE